MKKQLVIISFLLFSSFSYSQKVIQEVVLSPAGKSLNLISVWGLKSAISGAGPTNNYHLTSSLDFTDVENGGIMLRNQLKFTMYNEGLAKQWEVEIKKVFGLQAMPYSLTMGTKNAMYFVQVAQQPSFNNIHITRFDAQGQFIQTMFPIERKYDGIAGSFVNSSGLNMIMYKFNKKEKNIKYTLVTFPPANLVAKEKNLALEHNEYEIEKAGNDLEAYTWSALAINDNKMVLSKSYLKYKEGSKEKDLVVKTAEMTEDGTVSIPKEFSFVPTALKDTKYIVPAVELDTLHDELYIYGMMMVENNSRVNGIYVNKFDYRTGTAVYRREIPFNLFNQLIPEKDRRESIHFSFREIFPVLTFVQSTSYLDVPNQGLRLLLYNDSKGLLKDQLKLTGIRLNKNGDLELIEEYIYKNNIATFNDYYLIPEKRTVYWKDNNPNYQSGPLDYINSLGAKMDPEYTLCTIFYKKDYNMVVYVREKDSEIKAIKLEK
jgi:hypothetical protein